MKRPGMVGTAIVLLAALAWAAAGASTARQAVDRELTLRSVPRYRKVAEFLHRHREYARLAREVTWGAPSDRARAEALFAWTRARVRPTPPGWPVIDNHILNVIERGHGAAYQRADVLATLLTYAGVTAFWEWTTPPGGPHAPLVFALVEGRWAALDVVNGTVFRHGRGELQMPWPRLLHEARVASSPYSVSRISGQPGPAPAWCIVGGARL